MNQLRQPFFIPPLLICGGCNRPLKVCFGDGYSCTTPECHLKGIVMSFNMAKAVRTIVGEKTYQAEMKLSVVTDGAIEEMRKEIPHVFLTDDEIRAIYKAGMNAIKKELGVYP